jgi:hypothetical protein
MVRRRARPAHIGAGRVSRRDRHPRLSAPRQRLVLGWLDTLRVIEVGVNAVIDNRNISG